MRRNLPVLIFSALVLALFISLGNWQVRRLGEKQAYLAEIAARIDAAPVAVPATPDPARDRFLAVTASGTFTGPELHVLVSTRDQGAGYRIIQAFELGPRRVMVDRGLIPLAAKSTPRPAEAATVTGNLHWPDEIDSYTPATDLAANIWFARDVPALAAALHTDPVLIIARDTRPAPTGILPLPVSTEGIPNRHLEYIVTWYGLAVTWVVMTGYFLWRRRRSTRKPEPSEKGDLA